MPHWHWEWWSIIVYAWTSRVVQINSVSFFFRFWARGLIFSSQATHGLVCFVSKMWFSTFSKFGRFVSLSQLVSVPMVVSSPLASSPAPVDVKISLKKSWRTVPKWNHGAGSEAYPHPYAPGTVLTIAIIILLYSVSNYFLKHHVFDPGISSGLLGHTSEFPEWIFSSFFFFFFFFIECCLYRCTELIRKGRS